MSCPLCQYPYRCPCKNCLERQCSLDIKPWIRFEGELADFEACPCCGTTLHIGEWEDLCWADAKLQYKISNQSGGCLSGIVDEKDKLI